jgi:transcriptional regulator with GAF, ATPase, and Fis domain
MMEPASDNRFDPNLAAQLLLDISHEQSVEQLLQKLVQSTVGRPNIASIQIWLVDTETAGKLSDQSAPGAPSLYLAAAGGTPPPGQERAASRPDKSMPRVRWGDGILGQVATAGKQVRLHRSEEMRTLAASEWLEEQGICGFSASPIMYKGEVLGVTAAYIREELPEAALPWGLIFANHIGGAIANARAFEEIQRLKAQLELHNTYLQEQVIEAKAFGSLIGQSASLHQIIRQIDLVAPTEASVLILGETGTGKELVAHEIHRRSQRRDGPLVRVNCASIPRDLFESEFFGHVRGAFTGAVKDRAGRFETAAGGTIFLDEIGEIPMEMQNKLLRVLQEKRYERVGDDRTRSAQVRIIAATNRDLKKMTAAGRFREDLYYRLHVFPIEVPPLRERVDDIPLLAHHFVELSVRELKCAKPRLTRAGTVKLQGYSWPGNVRELRNVVERAVILARGGTLEFDLPITPDMLAPSRPRPRPEPRSGDSNLPGFLTEAELQRQERENLLVVLEKARWKIKGPGGAAELLGVKPTTLITRINKWGLKKPVQASVS